MVASAILIALPQLNQMPHVAAAPEIQNHMAANPHSPLPVQQHNYIYAIAKELKIAARRAGRVWGVLPAQTDYMINGTFYITNVISDGQVFSTHFPFRLSHMTYETLLRLFLRLAQSNDDLTIFDVKWTFIFDQHSAVLGAGPCKVPKWLQSGRFKRTWAQHTHNGRTLNCAAFAIAYKMTPTARRGTTDVNAKALEIMETCGWGETVSVFDILHAVPTHFKEYRITVVYLQLDSQADRTVAGPDYEYQSIGTTTKLTPECNEKTIYLIYDPEQRHFGGCSSPAEAYRFYHTGRRFCNRCVYFYDRYKRCRCDEAVDFRTTKIRQITPCTYCKRAVCKGDGCFRDCKFCGSKFRKGYDAGAGAGHRCVVFDDSPVTKFWKAGEEEKDKDPDYKLWVYDIESSLTIDETVRSVEFETDETGIFAQSQVNVFSKVSNAHTANLIVFRNVFDEDSEEVFVGPDCLSRFVEFLLISNQGRNIAIAHNASGYDSRLIFEAVIRMEQPYHMVPIRRGSKLMELRVKDVRFRDSLLFLPSSIAALAKSFALPVKKGLFPHLFNTVTNYDYNGPLPDKRFFDLKFSAKTDKDVADFHTWYEERSQRPWVFWDELIAYCKDDVKILSMLVKIFHDICVEKFEHSPWTCVTAPSYVHKVVLQKLSTELALPEDPEERAMIVREAVKNRWAVLRPSEYWFARRALRGGRTDVRKLRHSLTPEEIARGCAIKYVDVVSMYPAVQVKYQYPVGAPEIYIYDQDFFPCRRHENPSKGNNVKLRCDCDYETRKAGVDKQLSITEYVNQPSMEFLHTVLGFICVTCEPPKHLYHPTLVTWDDERSKCIATLNTLVEEVFTTVEFQHALSKGYKVIKVHRIDAYKQSEGLWNDFIKDLYIEKLANSGPTPNVEEQERLVTAYEEQFGMGDSVAASFDRWNYDGAMRTVYKTLLNCGWGKHCQRPNLDQHAIVNVSNEADDFFDNVQTGAAEISHIDNLVNGYQCIRTRNTSKTSLNCHKTYIPAGCYVPAYGRLTLLREMDMLGDRVLYHDTDSIIYIYDPTKYNIPQSDIWGCWDEEKISKKGIDAFVSLGPKTYAIKAGDEEIIKLKGLSIKQAHGNIVNFNALNDCIDKHLDNIYEKRQVPQYTFQYKAGRGITTRTFLKQLMFKPENLKGQLTPSLKIYPDGFCESMKNTGQCSEEH